ncbi:hypothetical protein [Paraflavitalea speifideaquila]|uniref:hypothetical protein n=1 Tax=Paraflavitalea speifideaquila TaxID=3076558 RepID=UPI0028F02520|nr:hypothetical protein [Paraflavitalea speifideiaquila]
MNPIRYLIALPLISLSTALTAQTTYSRVRLTIPGEGLAWLQEQGVEFDHGELNKEEKHLLLRLTK